MFVKLFSFFILLYEIYSVIIVIKFDGDEVVVEGGSTAGTSADEAKVDKVKDELADILIYAILFADKYGFDIPEIIAEKIEKNAAKYPTDKAKGNAKKYTDL